jgi:hypothetical protein
MGAEKSAPAGMGRSPIKAGGMMDPRRRFLIMASREETMFSKFPLCFMRFPKKITNIIRANSCKVVG